MPLASSSAVRPSLSSAKVHLLPVELLAEIILLVLQNWPWNQGWLALVCQRWHAIMLSMPDIRSRLWIQRATKKEVVQAFIQGRKSRFAVIVDLNDGEHGEDFNADDFHASLMTAVQAAFRWYSLELRSFPPPRESRTIVQPLETLLQPGCLHVFGSLTNLAIMLAKSMETPADILPHLQRLERFHAQHLRLPIYSPDASLPFILTLRKLILKSTSVQWMAGKVFPALQSCSITFPHHIDTICLWPVTMLACTSLTYESNDLGPLRHFHHPPLAELEVTSGQWNTRRGNPQFVAMFPIVVVSAQSLTALRLQVQCSEQLLLFALGLVPALVELRLRLASPHALSTTFFRAFVATNSNADACELAASPTIPLCAKLIVLDVLYKRWLRGPERKALIPVFGDIVSSRWSEENFVLFLSFEMPAQYWSVERPVDSIHVVEDYESEGYEKSMIGITSPNGIVPLEWGLDDPLTEVAIKEAEYLVTWDPISIGCLLTLHHLVELRVGDEQEILPTAPPPNLPLFHTLRVLAAKTIHPSFLAGQTFHELKRCRVSLDEERPNLSQDQVTQMPVCTRLDVDDVTLLATFKLPRIRELGASFDHPKFNMIWETHIAVNANLSGLKLLHVYAWYQQADLIQVFRCLPALQSLIIGNGSGLDGRFFGKFVPMGPNGASIAKQIDYEGQKLAILCPMLRSFLIEEFDSTVQLDLIPVLKDVVTLRAAGGCPLKRFTLFDPALQRKFKLIGRHGSFVGFVVKNVALDEDYKPFRLDI